MFVFVSFLLLAVILMKCSDLGGTFISNSVMKFSIFEMTFFLVHPSALCFNLFECVLAAQCCIFGLSIFCSLTLGIHNS